MPANLVMRTESFRHNNNTKISVNMEEKDNLEKAMTLMSSALKQYEEGKFDVADHSRREANKLFDEMSSELSTQDGVDKMRFGESRNFGILYSIVEANSKELYAKDKGKLKQIIETIKSNPILLSEFRTYNAFLNPTNVENPEAYVYEAVNLAKRYATKELKENNVKFLKMLRKLGLNENVTPSDDEIGLYEDIEYVILNKPDLRNICEYSHVKKRLSECVEERNIINEGKSAQDMKTSLDEAYEALSSKYGDELNEDEIKLVESLSGNAKDAERVFNETRDNLISKIRKELTESEGSERQRWNTLLEGIKSKTYNKKTALVDIAEMLEAADVFES